MTATSLLSILGGLVLLSGCLSNTPTKTLTGAASDPVAAAQRAALGLGDMAEENADSLPDLTATSFTGVGSGLTALNASNISSGTLATGRLTGSYTGITGLGTITTGTWQGTAISDTFLDTISTAGKVSNAATTATDANTANAIVARDINGDFAARNITATSFIGDLTGNAATATNATNATNATSATNATNVSGGAVTASTAFSTVCTTINLTADNTALTPSSPCINLTSDDPTAANRTFTLPGGVTAGRRLSLRWADPTNRGELLNLGAVVGTVVLRDDWTPGPTDTLELISDGSDWYEINRGETEVRQVLMAPTTLPTCIADLDGLIRLNAANYTLCVCNGTSLAWVNTGTGTVGDATTCAP